MALLSCHFLHWCAVSIRFGDEPSKRFFVMNFGFHFTIVNDFLNGTAILVLLRLSGRQNFLCCEFLYRRS